MFPHCSPFLNQNLSNFYQAVCLIDLNLKYIFHAHSIMVMIIPPDVHILYNGLNIRILSLLLMNFPKFYRFWCFSTMSNFLDVPFCP